MIKHLVIDVDGCLTDGTFTYTKDGKYTKTFGPDDSDALKMFEARTGIVPLLISADRRGWDITVARARDMGQYVRLVGALGRLAWAEQMFPSLREVAFMGDSFLDAELLAHVYGIVPLNAALQAQQVAQLICVRRGGDRAVAEAVDHLLTKFFGGGLT